MKKYKKRIMIAIVAGMLGSVLWQPQIAQERTPYEDEIAVGAWWGILYPEYCFAELDEKNENTEEMHFSFWVAKALNWW